MRLQLILSGSNRSSYRRSFVFFFFSDWRLTCTRRRFMCSVSCYFPIQRTVVSSRRWTLAANVFFDSPPFASAGQTEEGHFVAVRNDVPFDSFYKQSSTHATLFFFFFFFFFSSFLSSSIFSRSFVHNFQSAPPIVLQSLKV